MALVPPDPNSVAEPLLIFLNVVWPVFTLLFLYHVGHGQEELCLGHVITSRRDCEQKNSFILAPGPASLGKEGLGMPPLPTRSALYPCWCKASCLGVHVFYLGVDTGGFVANTEAYEFWCSSEGNSKMKWPQLWFRIISCLYIFLYIPKHTALPPLGLSWSCFHAISYTN